MICILKSKISFIGIVGWEYFVCRIEKDTFSVEKVEKENAMSLVEENNLQLEEHNKYGKVFSDGIFRPYCRKNPVAKYIIQRMVSSAECSNDTKFIQ